MAWQGMAWHALAWDAVACVAMPWHAIACHAMPCHDGPSHDMDMAWHGHDMPYQFVYHICAALHYIYKHIYITYLGVVFAKCF